MTTPEADAIPPDVLADLEEVARQADADGVLDPELLRRVQERSRLARAELLALYGPRELAVSLLREIREE